MYLLYPIIISLGVITSYTDIRSHKIRNVHLVLALCAGLIAYTYLILFDDYALNVYFVINFLVGTGISLLLYCTKTWAAGDAKLFPVFCLLMPTGKYSALIPYPSIVIFINTFLLGVLFMLLFSVFNALKTWASTSQLLNKIFSFETVVRLIESFLTIVCIGWIVPPIIQRLIPNISIFVYAVILYLSYHIIYAVVDRYVKGSFGAFVAGCFGFLAKVYFQSLGYIKVSPLDGVKRTLEFTLGFYCLRSIITSGNEKGFPFAPMIFLGTLLSNTEFINMVMSLLRSIR